MSPLLPRKTDSDKANKLRNILAAVYNLKTQIGDDYPFWQGTLDVNITYIENRLKAERRKK